MSPKTCYDIFIFRIFILPKRNRANEQHIFDLIFCMCMLTDLSGLPQAYPGSTTSKGSLYYVIVITSRQSFPPELIYLQHDKPLVTHRNYFSFAHINALRASKIQYITMPHVHTMHYLFAWQKPCTGSDYKTAHTLTLHTFLSCLN